MQQLLFFIGKLFTFFLIKPFLRVKSLPQHFKLDTGNSYIFVLPKRYAADELALKKALQFEGKTNTYNILFLPDPYSEKSCLEFFSELKEIDQDDNTLVIPTSIFWGRSPRKTKSIWQTWLSNSWSVPGRVKRCLIVLLQSRQAHCYFSSPLKLTADQLQNQNDALHFFTQQFIKQKEAVIGPDLSHRRILSQKVLQSKLVLHCIKEQSKNDTNLERNLTSKAQKYLNEMASDYSYTVVRLFDLFLSWVWERLYQGIEIKGMENINNVAEDHELVYVPCHRSHIDYLLLSYAIYHQGLMPPHIAAGINLNLPVVGSLLRRGGAFFIRRQFKDNPLYKAVLESYIQTMCQQGFSIEYFIEGGRSRTGFLLPPKPGMLAMTLRAASQQKDKPLAFIPVYIGYERMLESHSYINELYGKKKQKESLSKLFSAWRFLKEDYGKVFLSIGKPITLPDLPDIETSPENKQTFFNAVNLLGQRIQTEINHSAFVSSSNLISTALLGSQKNALLESQLQFQVELLQKLIQFPPLAHKIHIEKFNFTQALSHNVKLNLIKRNQHSLGDIYFLDQQSQVNATFLRNNSLHLFILPSLISCILINSSKISVKRIIDVCNMLYPYLKSEFFLPWRTNEIEQLIQHTLTTLHSQDLILYSNDFYRTHNSETEQFHALMVLSGSCKGSIERFYIAAQLISTADNGYYNKKSLEDACVQMAQRLSLLHEFHAPDFFDKNLFRMFIQSLLNEGIFTEDRENNIHYNKAFLTAKKFARFVLSPSVKRSIKQCTQSDL